MRATDLHKKLSSYSGEFDRPLLIASYFGFSPIEAPKAKRKDLELVRDCGKNPLYDAGEKVALIRTFIGEELDPEEYPISVSYRLDHKTDLGYGLNFIGTSSFFSEAVLIRTALSILEESGHKNLQLELNCIGDRESIDTYERELLNHLKKHAQNLPEALRESLKEDIFSIFELEDEALSELRNSLPQALAYLTSASRSYFKEVLEHIEALGVDFRLAPELVGNKHYCSHAIFAIKETMDEADKAPRIPLAIGYRYSSLIKRFGVKREIPMVGINIYPQNKRAQGRTVKAPPRTKFCLVHLGRAAKMRSIPLIELLRRERIRLYHYLGRDKLSLQLAQANALGASHLVILGQREALENTATVRNMSTRAQETVPVERLAQYLKKVPI